jgi:hypothetical protein
MPRALANDAVNDFAEPAPNQSYADAAKRALRGGFDPGARRHPAAGPTADGYIDDVSPPSVVAPTTSTTSTTRPGGSTTTTSTSPPPTIIN